MHCALRGTGTNAIRPLSRPCPPPPPREVSALQPSAERTFTLRALHWIPAALIAAAAFFCLGPRVWRARRVALFLATRAAICSTVGGASFWLGLRPYAARRPSTTSSRTNARGDLAEQRRGARAEALEAVLPLDPAAGRFAHALAERRIPGEAEQPVGDGVEVEGIEHEARDAILGRL